MMSNFTSHVQELYKDKIVNIPERFEFEAFIALRCRSNLYDILGVDSPK